MQQAESDGNKASPERVSLGETLVSTTDAIADAECALIALRWLNEMKAKGEDVDPAAHEMLVSFAMKNAMAYIDEASSLTFKMRGALEDGVLVCA